MKEMGSLQEHEQGYSRTISQLETKTDFGNNPVLKMKHGEFSRETEISYNKLRLC